MKPYLDRMEAEFVAEMDGYVVVDEEGDNFDVAAAQKQAVEEFVEKIKQTTAKEDRELDRYVKNQMRIDGDGSLEFIDDVIEVVREYLGIV